MSRNSASARLDGRRIPSAIGRVQYLLVGLLAVGCAAINTVSQLGAFLMPYAWGAAQDATGGFEAGLLGLAVAAGLAVAVALATRAEARGPRLKPQPA